MRGRKDLGNMHSQFLLHIAAVLQLLLVVLASFLPIHPSSSSYQPPITHGITFIEGHVHHSASASNLVEGRDLAQYLRDHHNMFQHATDWGRGYTCFFNTLDFFAPNYVTPAQEMSRFYSLALSAAGYEWGNGAPSNLRQFTWGTITLTMRSTQAIPFRFIRGFLSDMVRFACSFPDGYVKQQTNARHMNLTPWQMTHSQMTTGPGGSIPASYTLKFVRAMDAAVIFVELVLPYAGAAAAAR